MSDLPRRSPRNLAGLVAWLAWCGFVAAGYFVIPDDSLGWREPGELFPPPFAAEAARRAILAVAGAAVVLLAAWTTGRLLLRRHASLFTSALERVVVEQALGFGALAALWLLLALGGLYTAPVVRLVVCGIALIGGLLAATSVRAWPRAPRLPRLTWRDVLLGACGLAAAGFALAGALAPEIEYDALWYHLWLPDRWLAAGRPVDIVHEYVSLYPLTWELSFGAAMTIGGPVAAKLLHFASLVLLAITSALLATRWFSHAHGVATAAMAVAVPLMIWEGTTAYIDLALAWYVSGSVYCVVRHDDTADRRWLVLAALLMGIGLGVKHLGLVAFAVIGVMMGARRLARAPMRMAFRDLALFGALAMLVASPWYARAWLASGNPVFPDLYGVFGAWPADRWNSENERMLRAFKDRFGTDRSVVSLVALPWDVTMHGAGYGGTLGPVFLVLVPVTLIAAARRRAPPARTALLAGAMLLYGAVWASPVSSFQLRFLVPAVPFLALLAAEGLRHLPAAAWVVTGVLLVMNLPPFTAWHEADKQGWSGWLTHTMRRVPVPVLAGAESEENYLARHVPSFRAWRFLDENALAGARVLTFSGGDHLYSHVDRISSEAPAARDATWQTPAGEEQVARQALQRLGVTHVMVDLRQLAKGTAGTLAIASDTMRRCCLERLYDDGRFAVYRVR